MYGLPKDFDFSIFNGRTLEVVGFSANSIRLSFDQELWVMISSAYSHQTHVDEALEITDVPPSQSTLMRLAGKVVESAWGEGPGTLVLRFEDGQVLRCYDDTPMYECYEINHRGTTIYI